MALRRASVNTSHHRSPVKPSRLKATQPEALMQLNRRNLAKVFDAAAGANPGEPAALMGLRRFLQFLSDASVVPRLLSPADVATNIVSDATTGQRARDGWKISFNGFILRICLVAELAFGQQHSSGADRQRALLEYLAPSCERFGGVTLQLELPVETPVSYTPSPLRCDANLQRLHPVPRSASPRSPSTEKVVHKLQQRLAKVERQLRLEREAKSSIALHADQTCAALEDELIRLRVQAVSTRQKERALRAMSPRGDRGCMHGRDVLGALAIGIISRSRVNATAGWFQLWVARVHESELRRSVMANRQRADTAVHEAEEALTTLTLREERKRDRSHNVPANKCDWTPSRMQAEVANAELATTVAKAETATWQRRAEAEANARAMAEMEFSQERTALRNALAASQAAAAKAEQAEQAERDTRKAVDDRALVEKELYLEAKTRESEAMRELAAAQSSHLPVVAALQAVAAELRGELRASEMKVDGQIEVCNHIATKSGRRWRLARLFSRWRTLAFICGQRVYASQQRVLLVAVMLHQRRRAQLRRHVFEAWSGWAHKLSYG